MFYRAAADAILILHLVFVIFVVLGGVIVLRWPRLAWLHVPAVLWAAWIEFAGWICPLTPLEISLRQRAGEAGYAGDFMEHYLTSALYPEGLTRTTQIALGGAVVLINLAVYVVILNRALSRRA